MAELAGDAQRRKGTLGLRHGGDVVVVIRRRKVGRRIAAHIQVIAGALPAVADPEPAADSRFAVPKDVPGETEPGPKRKRRERLDALRDASGLAANADAVDDIP